MFSYTLNVARDYSLVILFGEISLYHQGACMCLCVKFRIFSLFPILAGIFERLKERLTFCFLTEICSSETLSKIAAFSESEDRRLRNLAHVFFQVSQYIDLLV